MAPSSSSHGPQAAASGRAAPALSFDCGRVKVDLCARRLVVQGVAVKLGGRSFDLLSALVEMHDQVVPRRALLRRVWPGQVVEENNLEVRVAALRRILGAAAIVTVSGRGYKFALQQDTPEPATRAAPEPDAVAWSMGLVGRDALLGEACRAIQSQAIRWLALSGPGGCGKTRLALHMADSLATQMADGAYVVMLAPVRGQPHVTEAIAGALGLLKRGDDVLGDRLVAFLQPRHVLLVLDNIEHLPRMEDDIVALLGQCARLKVVTTSRARLHSPRGHEITVPALGLPADDSIETILAAPSVELFVRRAAAVGHPVGSASAELSAVAQICRQLDGLPLAIELAAARLRVLTPDALSSRLQHRLSLLVAGVGHPHLPHRQQTLRHTMAWSHELLTPDAQHLFGRLGVFVGGWSIDAAEAVGQDRTAVLDLLEELIDQNLVQRVEDVAGQPRYAMLETIREYAQEQLVASGDEATVCQRHAEHFAALMGSMDRRLRSGGRQPALQVLRVERHNLRAAMAWSIAAQGQAETAAGLVAPAAWWWYFDDAASEGEAWADACLKLPMSPVMRARVMLALARAQVHGGKIQPGLGHAVQAQQLAQQTGDVDTQAQALLLQAIPVVTQSRERAVALMQRCLDQFRTLGQPWDIALATAVLGMVLAWEPGAEDQATPLLREARQRFLVLGDQWCLTTALHHLARISERQGLLDAAQRYAQQALDAATAAEYRFLIAGAQHHLARIALAQGDLVRAMHWAGKCMATRWAQGDRRNLLLHCRWLGGVYWRQGRVREAIVLFAVGCDELDEGLSLAATIMSPGDRSEWSTAREAARSALPEAELDALWREAAALPIEQALAQAGIRLEGGAMRTAASA